MSRYRILVESLRDYFQERHPDVSIATDIFEHGFLRFFGYHSVPERCQFSPIDDLNEYDSFYLHLRTPYGVSVNKLGQDLQSCARDKLSQVLVEEIKPSSNNGFCVRLTVPYQLIKENVRKLSVHIDLILSEPGKKEAYRYWTQHLVPYGLSLSIVHIEVLIGDIQQNFPSNTLDEIWSAVVKKASASKKEHSLRVLSQSIQVDKEHYPEIAFSCQIGCDKTTLILTRDKIIRVLKDPIGLHQFLIEDTANEFLLPAGIHAFIKEKYYRSFKRCVEGHYEIDLGYHYKELKTLEKFSIKEISSYRPMTAGERSRYYVYNQQNYFRALIALKEIKGESCHDERLHQLKYAIRTEKWEQLAEKLDFFLNFEAKTDLNIDYLELGLRLFDFAKEKLEKEASVKTIEILEKAFNALIDHKVAVTHPKKLHAVLFEINLMRMECLIAEGGDEAERLGVQKKIFIHAQQAGLPESNRFLAELCGLDFGHTLTADVSQDPLAVVAELAARLKTANTALAKLSQAPRHTRSFFATALKESSAVPNASAIASISLTKK